MQAFKSKNNAEQVQILADLISHIESFEFKTSLSDAILLDLKDQVNLAFTQYFDTWGQYYIPSLIFAYLAIFTLSIIRIGRELLFQN